MARTVKVGLDVDEQPYVRGVERSTKTTDKFKDSLDDVTGSAKDTAASTERAKESTEDLGGSAKDAGRDLDRLRADAQKLDRQIDETSRSIRDLAREIARTSDEAARADLSKKLNVEQGRLREKVTLRKLIDVDSAGDMGAELAEKVSVSFAAKLGPLLARAPMAGMNPAVLAIGAPIVAGVVTLLGTAVGGAIIGGVGVGGVVGGLALAAQDPRVKAAGTELGEDLSEMLGRASSAFVPETLGAIDTISRRVGGMEGDFARAFTSASRYVDPLVDGLLDAADNAMPGLIDAIDAAGPVIEVVAEGARDLGEALGEGLSDLAPYADEGARALQVLFAVMNGGVEATFALIEGMAALYKVAEIIGAVMTGDVPRVVALAASWDDAGSSGVDLEGKLGPLRDRIGEVGGKASGAAVEVETLNEALHRLVNQNVSVEEANIALEESIDRAAEAAKRNGKGIDENIPKQRENRKALVDIAKATQEVYDRTLEQTGSHELAAAAAERGRKKFLETADAMGVEKGKAVELAGKLIAIPNVTRTVTVRANTQPALDSAKAIVARINNMNARINVSAEPSGGFGGSAHTGHGYSTGNRWGGVYEHAQVGVLREAQIAAPAGPARYAWAEPATGGEAFIPRFGKRERSLDILSKAARWYGQQIMPAGARQGGGSSMTNHYYWQPQQATASMADFEGFQRRQDALARVGRPR